MNYKELAAAIRQGHTMIRENSKYYLYKGCGCALGAAAVGANKLRVDDNFVGLGAIAELLGIPFTLACEISRRHQMGESRLAIANSLKPEQKEESDSDWAKRKVAEVTRVKEAA